MRDQYKQRWDMLIILCVIFNSFSIPLGIAFDPKAMKQGVFNTCMTLIDIAFIIDIIICFRTTILDKEGREITDAKIIAN